VARLAEQGVITDYRTPDRFRFGLPALTTRFTDVWDAAQAARDLIAESFSGERYAGHG
jgi:kynureninase